MRRILLIGLVVLLVAGCSGEQESTATPVPESEPGDQFKILKHHTNPPIVIGNGSIKWYRSQEESLEECASDAACDPGHTCVKNLDTNPNKGWCVMELTQDSNKIFDADGNCTTFKDSLPAFFIEDGTNEAMHGVKSIIGDDYTIESDDYALNFEIGKGTERNVWTLHMGDKSCLLSSASPLGDAVPWELGELQKIKKPDGTEIATSIWFATCKEEDCV